MITYLAGALLALSVAANIPKHIDEMDISLYNYE